MRSKAVLTFLTFLGVAAIGNAQANVTVLFPDAGEREVWIGSGPPTAAPTSSLRTNAASVEVPTTGKSPTDTVFVWDKRTGNIATHSLKDVQTEGSWTVPAAAYKDLGQITVRIEHGGKPVAAADVTVDDARRPQNTLLDSTSNGETQFFDLKPGQLKVTAKYKARSGETKSVTQLLDAPLGRTTLIPKAVISIADDVETIAEPPAAGGARRPRGGGGGGGAAASPAPEAPKDTDKTQFGGNTVGSIATYLIGLIFAAGLVYAAVRYGKQNQSLVESKLKQLGVDIPQPGDDMGGPVAPVAPLAPVKAAPPEKIILTDSAPDPITPIAATPVFAVTGEPKLVSETGDAMNLPEGETVVGREVGLGLSLVGESTVSRMHAQIVKNGNEVTVNDMGSTNGTYVNGVKVQSPTSLRSGDAVQFGSVKFRYEG